MRKLFILLIVIFDIGYLHTIIIPNSFGEDNFSSYAKAKVLNIDKIYNKGIALYQEGHYEKALFNFNQIIKAGISDTNLGVVKTYANLGIIHTILGNADQAVFNFVNLIVKEHRYYKTFAQMNNEFQIIIIHPILDFIGLNNKTLLDKFGADTPFKTHSSAASIYNNLGMAYFMKRQRESVKWGSMLDFVEFSNGGLRAIPVFKKAIELAPNWAEVYNNLGKVYFEFDYKTKAIKYFKKAIELDPKFAEAYFNRSQVYQALKYIINAFEDIDTAIKLGLIPSEAAEAYYNRSKIQLLRNRKATVGNKKQALEDLNKAIRFNPTSAKLYNARGLIQLKLGRYTKAITDFTKAVELEPITDLKHWPASIRNSEYRKNQVKAEEALKKQNNGCSTVF